MMIRKRAVWIVGGLAAVLAGVPVGAVVKPDRSSPVGQKEFRHPALHIPNALERSDSAAVKGRLPVQPGKLGVAAENAFLDVRSGRYGTLVITQPLIPGTGRGNTLTWAGLGMAKPATDAALGDAALQAFGAFLQREPALGIDTREMAPRV